MLLSSGRCVYNGPAAKLVPHLAACGYPCALLDNPLDHAVDVIVVDKRTRESEAVTTKRLDGLVAAYRASPLYTSLQRELAALVERSVAADDEPPVRRTAWDATRRAFRRWGYTFDAVLNRQLVNLGRNPYDKG